MLKIFGHPMSTCTRKVLMTLAETGTAHELTVVDFGKGEHKQEAHVGRQPFGQVPTLEDGGFSLYESRPMCRYINDKVGGNLVPKDLQARALMDQWISVETSNFTPHAMKFIYQYTFGRPQDAAVLEAAGQGLEKAASILDKQLAKTAFLAGDEISLADIYYMPYLEYAMGSPAKEIVAKFPHMTAWWNKLSERPTWQKAVGRA